MSYRDSRHLYDIAKILPLITFDSNIELFNVNHVKLELNMTQ